MAIGFARLEFVKRSAGKNACAKAAYNSRDRLEFQGNKIDVSRVYDWSRLEKPLYHIILLPKGVDPKFQSAEFLWNSTEAKENRINSQVAIEMVLALPDDEVIAKEEKYLLAKSFVEKHFVSQGLAVQLDIHQPQVDEQGAKQHNWHAHVLATTRRFSVDGQHLGEKARDLMPQVNKGKVTEGVNWEKEWTAHQNQFFKEKGINLTVEPKGIVSEIHLGPVRMRGRAFSLLNENRNRQELNELKSQDPKAILEKLTENKSTFSHKDVLNYLNKHVDPLVQETVKENFWKQMELVRLFNPETKEPVARFTSQEVYEEEQKIVRLADRIQDKKSLNLAKNVKPEQFGKHLNQEQKQAFDHILTGQSLTCLEGHAGTGKSFLMHALKQTYEANGYIVRGLGPDNATAQVLIEKGLTKSENVYRFLFCHKNDKREILAGKEVWIIDEASKLGNRPLLELLKVAEQNNVQLLLAGCSAQLPSVERGGLFTFLSQRYGAQVLENIQRQEQLDHKQMVKQLAKGEMSRAIHSMAALGGLKWAPDKQASLDALYQQWLSDRLQNPKASTLIIAHSNAEISALNEKIRLYRRAQGEIEDKEYKCQTAHGALYISVGDQLEFRKKDVDLGITNGLKGTLIKAEQDSFTVAVKQAGQIDIEQTQKEFTRLITFNPSKYNHFQLGYATTIYRSQGKTIDKAYVLHSPMINKELFYVGLTRHVKTVNLFIAQTEVPNLTALKQQVTQSGLTPTTLAYTTQTEIEGDQMKKDKQMEIEQLKNSPSFLSKLKGYGLDVWHKWHTKAQTVSQNLVKRQQDQEPSEKFFSPLIENNQDESLKVASVKDLENQQDDHSKVVNINTDQVVKAKIDNPSHQQPQNNKLAPVPSFENPLAQSIGFKEIRKHSLVQEVISPNKNSAPALSTDVQTLLRTYQKSWQYAASIKPKEGSTKEWQQACGERNSLAFKLYSALPPEQLKERLGPLSFDIVVERALRHEESIKRQIDYQEKQSFVGLEDKLKLHIESLVCRLFPEEPSKKANGHLRYGSKGSLAIALQGPKVGCFKDFEKQEGGGPLLLIQRTLNLQPEAAKKWAKEFLNEPLNMRPYHYQQLKDTQIKDTSSEWHSLKPSQHLSAPALKELSPKLAQEYQEIARHAYKNEKGELLFYTLRLQEKQNPSNKLVLPLSYGAWQESQHQPKWWLKGYQSLEGKPLYNLTALLENPGKRVLIVEGEKTADAAQQLLAKDNYVCVTWSGGASAIHKTDWTYLQGREVVIWPDNDPAGHQAAKELTPLLRRQGIKSVGVVDQETLAKNFPTKWDLADPLPEKKTVSFIRDLILKASPKNVELGQLVTQLAPKSPLTKPQQWQAQALLHQVEERVWPQLEQKGLPYWEIQNSIIKETTALYRTQEKMEQKLLTQGIGGELNQKVALQTLLYQAKTGKEASKMEIEQIKGHVLAIIPLQLPLAKKGEELKIAPDLTQLITDQVLHATLSKDIYRKIDSVEFVNSFEKELKTQHKLATIQLAQAQIKGLELSKRQEQEHTL